MNRTIINYTLLVGLLLSVSCNSDKNKKQIDQPSADEILRSVREVKAIGKVVSSEDWAVIASNTPAEIKSVLVSEGDSVQSGQLLIALENKNLVLDIQAAQAKLTSLQEENKTSISDIHQAEVLAEELREKYETSKALYAQGAETRERLKNDQSNWQQQQAILQGLQQKLIAQRASEKEQAINLEKAQQNSTDFQLRARKEGIVMDLVAKVGQSITSGQELGKIIKIDQPLIEAEVDELFAGDIRVGQTAEISPRGLPQTPISGTVIYVSAILSNKSILYETANEGEDRRVRKIKIQPKSEQLQINTKVDCTINIR